MEKEEYVAVVPVKVYQAQDRLNADMIVEILVNNNIHAYRQSVGSGEYLGISTGMSLFGEDIYVDEKDVKDAQNIIKEFLSEDSEEYVGEYGEEDTGGKESENTAEDNTFAHESMRKVKKHNLIIVITVAILVIASIVAAIIIR